ncbi:uncharacterized protein LOC127519843 isoform X2 [Ctenopharyngodon idella]|uniref:uncharacterized protein LOC127519843 isoform X2 n=1 Tax=Ctenopharyngodon idella TaxID=7959 RepID=UPI00222E933F|nr:uncharacterized protein LOC127519843 isoform X2 [Ctenopharyngodon idella]
MFHTFVFCSLCFCHLVGVFGDELKSVMEGESVLLQINVTEIQTGDEITWTFGTNKNLLAETDGVTIKIPDDLDERFRDKLKLDHQTGSLTITNITTEHSGVYEVEISLSSSETKHRFTVTVYGVFGVDELKSVSVTEGESVLLQINVTKIQTGDEITWTFGTNKNLLAETDGVTIKIPDDLDERFRDRLKLDKKTGSLTITNTRTEHTGVYEVIISGSSTETKHRFNVTVNDSTFCCHGPEIVTRLVISAAVGLATVFILVYDITSRKAEEETT